MQGPDLDIVTVAIALATLLFGPKVAGYVGPYAVIFLGALGGASWSAAKRGPESRGSALLHIAWMVGLALIATVPAAELAAKALGLEARWMLAPAAVVIAARPSWLVEQARGLWERRTGGVPPTGGNNP